MAKRRVGLLKDVLEILDTIDNGNNFLLSGGAGSGKTYSLIQVVKQLFKENPAVKIACITYTNSAVKKIEENVDHDNLLVSTIHDFLWDNIKHFQNEIKCSLVALINDSKIKKPDDIDISFEYFDSLKEGIRYKEYLKISEGVISHDEVILIANHLFKNYPKLCDILVDKFKYIFVDEYQDTSKDVVDIFLIYLQQSSRKNIIGFFGDSMQSIYDNGVGTLKEYIDNTNLVEVKKEQNRRNPQLVIDLANKIRMDGLVQSPSSDLNAPNMDKDSGVVKSGDIKFYYSSDSNILRIEHSLGWDFKNTEETKILNLTHNLIAPKAGFETLMNIYDKDPIFSLKKRILQKVSDGSIPVFDENETFDEIVERYKFKLKNREGVFLKDVIISENRFLYDSVKNLPFIEIKNIYLDKDQLLDDQKQKSTDENKKNSKRDDLIKHLFKIQDNIYLYDNYRYNEFIRKTEYKISSVEDKIKIQEKILKLKENKDKTIGDIIDMADAYGICKKDDNLSLFMSEKKYVYDRVKEVKFSEFQNLYDYLEGYTPFSTQHKTKGDEFGNVLVILDNGGWFKYNFVDLFEKRDRGSISESTKKIFYVCITRAKDKLAVFFHNPSGSVIETAKEWFGDDNVVNLDN